MMAVKAKAAPGRCPDPSPWRDPQKAPPKARGRPQGPGPPEAGRGFFAHPKKGTVMPELPEVETIRRGLVPHLPGRRVARVEVRCPRILVHPSPEAFRRALEGQTFQGLDRVGKLLILELDASTLLVHLGMTGQLTLRDPSRADEPFRRHPVTGLERTRQHAPDAHTHLLLHLDDGSCLCYRDVRKFGRWWLYPRQAARSYPPLERLGPDPLTPEYRWEDFERALAGTRRAVKAVLLDQSVLAGVGNIYADEALFAAGIRPSRRADRLSRAARRRLFEAVPRVLRQAIEGRGTTFSDYRDARGEPGTHQEALAVYGRGGQPCPACGQALVRSTVAGRTSTWCPRCQK